MRRQRPLARPDTRLLHTLAKHARSARTRARAPYSKFKVGAALHGVDGRIFTGGNIENAAYPLTICAERVAVFQAITQGHRRFDAIAVIGDPDNPTAPCGSCRQVLWELAGDVWVYLVSRRGQSELMRLSDLLPLPFDASYL